MQDENQNQTPQETAHQQAQPQPAEPNPAESTPQILADDEAYYESNYSKRLKGIVTGAFFVMLIIIGLFIIRSIGLETSTFSEAKQYDDYATSLKFALAAAAGLTLAYIMNHPIKPVVKYVPIETGKGQEASYHKKSDTVWIVLIAIGLTLMYIPGLILLAIYVLKKRLFKEKDPDAGKPVSRFRKVIVRPVIGTGTLVVAFMLGAIPAFIVGMIIGYPLSNHACDLSGSKYC